MSGHSVYCERFNTHGQIVETHVEFSINRIGNEIYIYIKGSGPAKSFVMPARDWQQLNQAATEGTHP